MYGANPSAMPHPPDVEAGGGLLDGLADWFVGWAGTLAGYGSRAIVRKGKGWACSEKATESCLVQVGCDVLSSPLTHSPTRRLSRSSKVSTFPHSAARFRLPQRAVCLTLRGLKIAMTSERPRVVFLFLFSYWPRVLDELLPCKAQCRC
jgi:hypothetical protein